MEFSELSFIFECGKMVAGIILIRGKRCSAIRSPTISALDFWLKLLD